MTNCSSPHGQISYKNRIKKKLNIIIRIKNEILKWNNDPSWFRVGGPPNEKSSLENKRDHFKIEPMPKNHGPIWNHLHNLNNPEFGQKKKKRTVVTCTLSCFHYSIPLALRRFASSKKNQTHASLSVWWSGYPKSKIERTHFQIENSLIHFHNSKTAF